MSSKRTDGSVATARVLARLKDRDLGDRIVTPVGRIMNAPTTAAALGVRLEQIAKTIVCLADSRPVLVVVRGSDRVDTEQVKAVLGAREVRPAPAKDVTRLTGFPVGGASPIGCSPPAPVLIDQRLNVDSDLYVSAGSDRAVFRVTFAELLELAGEATVLF